MNRRKPAHNSKAPREKPTRRLSHSLHAWREQHLQSLFSSLGRLWARPWTTALTVAVLGFALALPALFWLALDNARGLGVQVADASAISVFLKPDLDAQAVDALAARLRQRADIAELTVRTPQQGLDEFRARSGFARALDVLHANPLPAVLLVQPRGTAVEPLVAALKSDTEVEQVQDEARWRQRLAAILGLAQRGALTLAGLLALAALLVIGNTVRTDIAARSEEIAVMQLLGAEPGFVRRPFLYTGLWYGTLAGGVCLMLIGIVQGFLAAPLAQLATAYDHAFALHGMSMAQMALLLLASAALGWFGALLAASRHIAIGLPR